jgi:AraC-like DNA-binding protein
MLVDARRYAAPELDAVHETIDVRVPWLRVSYYRGRNVATDYGLLETATPFVHRLHHPQLTLLLEGTGRFEEADARAWVEGGTLIASDAANASTEAYAGEGCAWLCVTWDPTVLGAKVSGRFTLAPLGKAEIARLRATAADLGAGASARAMSGIVSILRAFGVPFAPLSARDIAREGTNADYRALQATAARTLADLRRYPDVEDVASALGWNQRLVARRMRAMANRYSLPWAHWREALHQTRVLQALRLLSAPGATTELVARLTGFRTPTSLCHTFAKAGLPSPGALARAAKSDALCAWSEFVRSGKSNRLSSPNA